MIVEVREESAGSLAEYARVPIAFEVRSVLDVTPVGDGFALAERPVAAPYVKDYDALPGEGPAAWPRRFDVLRWGFFGAHAADRRVGAAAIAHDTPGVAMLRGRTDLAVLWDLRVAPGFRRRGVGASLLAAAETWARGRGCLELEVETQNVNVPACRFYARHGFALRSIDRSAYPDLPGEIQMIWHETLTHDRAGA